MRCTYEECCPPHVPRCRLKKKIRDNDNENDNNDHDVVDNNQWNSSESVSKHLVNNSVPSPNYVTFDFASTFIRAKWTLNEVRMCDFSWQNKWKWLHWEHTRHASELHIQYCKGLSMLYAMHFHYATELSEKQKKQQWNDIWFVNKNTKDNFEEQIEPNKQI